MSTFVRQNIDGSFVLIYNVLLRKNNGEFRSFIRESVYLLTQLYIEMGLYQSLREPPILTSVIGAECSDGIALVADTQLTRSVDKELEFMDDEKIKADLEHFIVGYGQI
jgi:hypothetical protein